MEPANTSCSECGEEADSRLKSVEGRIASLTDTLEMVTDHIRAVTSRQATECIQPAPTFQTAHMTVTATGVDMNRDGIPYVLSQPYVSYSAHVQCGAPVGAVPTFRTVAAQLAYQYDAPQEVQYAVAKPGTTYFLEAMADGADSNLIGQFSADFNSAFLVVDRTSVTSKCIDDPAQLVVDWTTQSVVTQAKNQRQCDSCLSGYKESSNAEHQRRVLPRSCTACAPQSNSGMTHAQTVSMRTGAHSPLQVVTMQMWHTTVFPACLRPRRHQLESSTDVYTSGLSGKFCIDCGMLV